MAIFSITTLINKAEKNNKNIEKKEDLPLRAEQQYKLNTLELNLSKIFVMIILQVSSKSSDTGRSLE